MYVCMYVSIQVCLCLSVLWPWMLEMHYGKVQRDCQSLRFIWSILKLSAKMVRRNRRPQAAKTGQRQAFFLVSASAFGHVCAWLSSKALQEVPAVNAGQGRCSVASMLAEGRLAQNSADQHLRGKHVEAETWAV